jgi:hypothetical protein
MCSPGFIALLKKPIIDRLGEAHDSITKTEFTLQLCNLNHPYIHSWCYDCTACRKSQQFFIKHYQHFTNTLSGIKVHERSLSTGLLLALRSYLVDIEHVPGSPESSFPKRIVKKQWVLCRKLCCLLSFSLLFFNKHAAHSLMYLHSLTVTPPA